MTTETEWPHIGSGFPEAFSLTDAPGSQPITEGVGLHEPKQYNFARHWRRKIAPHLDDPGVIKTLTLGLKLYDIHYGEGDPPWLVGRGSLNGRRARAGCLSWYQPWGRCHYIAPFCWALGVRLYPNLKWGFLSGKWHTVVIGWSDSWERPEWVMDILLFREKSGQESLNFVKLQEFEFHDGLGRYVASFFSEPEAIYAQFGETIGPVLGDVHEARTTC